MEFDDKLKCRGKIEQSRILIATQPYLLIILIYMYNDYIL